MLTENYQKLKAELLTAKYEKSQIAQEKILKSNYVHKLYSLFGIGIRISMW